ncbi:hypothetical protein F5888DRAFT_1638319 [Russula emetica]|nr:hypothetical protein F5888DRAFT_1638319 [Russula emetica]
MAPPYRPAGEGDESMNFGSGAVTNIWWLQYCIVWRSPARLVKYGPVETAIGFAVGVLAVIHIDDTRVLLSPNSLIYDANWAMGWNMIYSTRHLHLPLFRSNFFPLFYSSILMWRKDSTLVALRWCQGTSELLQVKLSSRQRLSTAKKESKGGGIQNSQGNQRCLRYECIPICCYVHVVAEIYRDTGRSARSINAASNGPRRLERRELVPVEFPPVLYIYVSPRKIGRVLWHPAAQDVLASDAGNHSETVGPWGA